ncbi:hypothetical protein [Candidatus Nitrosotenuis uzonensis]|uniref:Uncharacterized protein n=1 Tax=Candidatus Nitrosotenuis uzonensis TaxID=1407055 RepID=V6AT23_9ARCH|nr:hypothetical protein [Candidatus Nitrosotenuis uzonensis]CDI05655.1 exported hypothetical protein [Candidatus Nitrosotenuis uzonensis]
MIVQLILVFLIPTLIGNAFAAPLVEYLNDITDLLYDNENIYFFEIDRSIQSQTWIADTKIIELNDHTKHPLSSDLFIYPTELSSNGDYLYFATLADECVGFIACDYQNIIRVSKIDGISSTLATGLKSAIHIHMEPDSLYVSESNGNIWEINFDGTKRLIHKTDNIILDVAYLDGSVFWIEEVNENLHKIMAKSDQSISHVSFDSPHTVYDTPSLPYSLDTSNGRLRWNEIYVNSTENNVSDYTAIMEFDGKTVRKIYEFKNTANIARFDSVAHYKPHLIAGEYIFLVNNTQVPSSLHMIHLYNGSNTLLDPSITNAPIFLRAESDKIFLVGKTGKEFSIDQYSLPVVVPEFPASILILVGGIILVIVNRFTRLGPSSPKSFNIR